MNLELDCRSENLPDQDHPIKDTSGETISGVAVLHDDTENEKIQEELIRKDLREVIEALPSLIKEYVELVKNKKCR